MDIKIPFHQSVFKTIIISGFAVTAFTIGIYSSQKISPVVAPTNASSTVLDGDMNHNGVIDPADAQIALDIARGYKVASPEELAADPNHDFHITADDAMAILEILNRSVGISK
jgi:hypothetical protein